MDQLKLQIIHRVFYHLGIDLRSPEGGNVFVLNNETLIEEKLSIDVEGSPTEKTMWAAELPLQGGKGRVIVSDLSDDDFREFAVAFQFQDLPVYGVRLSGDPDDPGEIRVRDGKGQWIPATTFLQATLLAGFEQLAVFTPLWNKCEEYSDLRDNLIDFLLTGEEVHEG